MCAPSSFPPGSSSPGFHLPFSSQSRAGDLHPLLFQPGDENVELAPSPPPKTRCCRCSSNQDQALLQVACTAVFISSILWSYDDDDDVASLLLLPHRLLLAWLSPHLLLSEQGRGNLHPGVALLISSPPPVSHPINPDASHFVSPVQDWSFKVGYLNPLHDLTIQGLFISPSHSHRVVHICPAIMMV